MYRADKVFEMLDTVCECISALKQHGGSIIGEVTGPLSTVVTTNGLKGGLMSTEYVLLAV